MKAKLLTFVRGLKTGTPPRFQSYLKSLTLLLVLMVGVGEAWGATTITFTSKSWAPWTSNTDGSSFESTGSARGVANNGVSGSCKSTSSYSNVTKIEVVASSNTTGGKVAIKIGDTQIANKSITNSTNATYTYDASDLATISSLSGLITIAVTTSSKTVYVKSITITAASGTTVTLDPNYIDAPTPYPTVSAENGKAMPSATMPERTGYTFGGFFAKNDGSGTKYYKADGTSANNWDKSDATATIYANWSAKLYDVTLDKNEHATDDGGMYIYYNDVIDSDYFSAVSGIDSNYDLLGYFTATSGGTKVVNANGTLVSNVAGWTTSDGKWAKDQDKVTLYAQYEVKTTKYAAYVDVNPENSGTVTINGEEYGVEAAAGATMTVVADKNQGYVFKNWSAEPSVDFVDATAATTTFPMPANEVTITANFEAAPSATLTLSELEETRILSGSYVVGDVVTLPTTVVVECQGKQLVGWSTSTVDETDTKPTSGFYEKGAQYTLSAATQTLYAVYAKVTSQPDTWSETALANLTSNDVFVFSDGSYAMTNDNSTTSAPSAVSITVENSKITSDVNANMKWNIGGNGTDGYIFYPNGSTKTWLYCNTTASSSSNNNMRVGTGDRKLWVVSSNKLKTNDSYTARYISNYSNSDFRGYTSSSSAFEPKFYKCTPGSSETTKYSTSGTKKVPLTTIQAIQEAATTTEQDVQITFNNWVVTGVSSDEDDNYDIVYLSDGTEYGLEMDLEYNSGYSKGQQLSGTISAKLKKTSNDIVYIYDLGDGISKTSGGSETVTDKTIPNVTVANNGIVVGIKGVTYHDDDNDPYFYDSSNNKIYFYNAFGVEYIWSKLTDDAVYNVQGVVACYTDGTISLECREASEFVECLATPTNLAVSNITATGMTVSWTAVDNATSYDVIVNGGDPISVTTNPKELTGLTACTEYTIKVIAKATGYVASQAVQTSGTTINDKTITINLTNTQEADGNLYKSGSASVLPCTAADISLTYSVTDDYDLPETITVTIGGATATAGTDYTWSAATGVVIIPAAKQTGSIVITINSPETSKTYYRLNFDKNGGSGDDMAEIKRVSTATEAELTIVLPACTFTPPTGKEFNYWSQSTTSPSKVTQVVLNQENTVVYAIWKDVTYTLENISVKTNPKTAYQDGEELDLTGLVLNANYSASYGEGKTEEVTSGYTSTPEEGTKLTQNTNVVITYQQKTCTLAVTVSPTFSITYNVTLGNVAAGAPTTVAEGGTFTYPAVENVTCAAGYTFAGWTTDGSFAGGASAPSDLKAAGATSATVSANVVLYAVYNKSKTTATTFAEFAADNKMTSAPFVIAAYVNSSYIALPNSSISTSTKGTLAGSTIKDITSASELAGKAITLVKNGTSYNIKVNNTTNYLCGEASNKTGLYAVTSTSSSLAIWAKSNETPAQGHGTYRLTTGSRCLRYNTGNSTNKFGHYGINTQDDSPYYDVEIIPVPVTTANYSLDPECKAERALELVSSEGTEIRLVEGETTDSKTTTITAKDGTGSEGAITLSYSGSESDYVTIDGANVTFIKDGTYLIDASQAATQSYAATTAKITITVNKAYVTLTYDGNGATSGVPAAVTEIVKGTSVNAASGNDMVYGQNAFDKWGTTPEGGTKYAAGASVTMNKSMTLYAQWIEAYSVNISECVHGTITSSPVYAKAGVEVTLTINPEDGYVLRPNSLKVLKENGEKVYCPESTGVFDMPASNVTISAEFVKGALYKQRRVNQQSIVCDQTGNYPDGATATFASTYAGTSNNITQLTDGNNMTYTIKGYAGQMIKSITLSMKSNSGSGAGTMYVKVGTNKISEIAASTTFNQWFDNTAYQTNFVDVHVTMPKAIVATDEDIVIYIACTTKSLYCQSVFIEWATPTTTRTISGTYGTICLAKDVEAGNYMGGSFYEGDYLLMDAQNKPYKYYLTEVDHLEAGYPYVFVKDQNADAIYVAETGEAVTKAESKRGLVGTFVKIEDQEEGNSNNVLEGNYMLSGGLFWECGEYCSLKANRAYLDIRNQEELPRHYTEQPAPVGARRLVLTNQAANTPNTPTGWDYLTEDGVNNNATAQKFIIDEKLVIIRGGKMYNASGAIVK